MSRFNFCDCPAGFEAEPERHAPDCPGRSGAGKRGPTPVPATVKFGVRPKPYPDRLCHVDYTAHPYCCGCLSGDEEAQRRFDEHQRADSVPLTGAQPEVVAVINEEGDPFKETVVEHRPGIDLLPVGTELVDIAHVIRLTAERDALQQRLNAADQRNADRDGTCEWSQEDDSGIWNSGCGVTWSFHDDGPTENGMHFCHSCGKTLVVEPAEAEPAEAADWHMNPCKQGHRDVGAASGVASCYQCDEKIVAATTQEAFEHWNATHPQQ